MSFLLPGDVCMTSKATQTIHANSKPSMRYAMVVIFVTSLFFFYEFGLNNIFDALEQPIAQGYALGPTMMGFISSLYFYANIVFLIPAGLLLDRFSPKWLIVMAMFICSLGVLAVSISDQLFWLMASRLMMGIGGGFCFIGCIRIAVNWFSAKHMAKVTALIVTMGMLGGYMVNAPLAYLMDMLGWRQALMVVAIVGFVIMFLVLFVVKDYPEGAKRSHKIAAKDHHGLRATLKAVLCSKQNWLCGLFTSTLNIPIYMLGALWGIPYLMFVHHFTRTQSAEITGMLFVGTMIGSPFFGWLSDKIERRKVLMIVGAVLSLALAYYLTQTDSQQLGMLMGLFFVLGFITSCQILSYPVVAESNQKSMTSTATSIISICSLMGGVVSQPLFGYVLTWHHASNHPQYAMAIQLLPLIIGLGLIFAFFIRETRAKSI